MTGLDRLHEIAEDVGRTAWLRELGAALSETADAIEGGTSDPSGYESDVLAWVEENGGLDSVKERLMPEGMEWLVEAWPRFEDNAPVRLGDMALIDGYPDMVEAVQLWIHGKPVIYGDNGSQQLEKGERVKRPEILAADGVPLEVGQTVWRVDTGAEYWVKRGQTITADAVVIIRKTDCDCESEIVKAHQLTHQCPALDAEGNCIEPAMDVWWVCEGDERGIHAEKLHVESIDEGGFVTCSPFNGGTWVELESSELYVNRPVLDADGVPIKKGDTVWDATTGAGPFTVREIERSDDPDEPEDIVWCGEGAADGFKVWRIADQLTHTKPEPDTWERIEKDKGLNPFDYCKKVGHKLWTFDNAEEFKARDLVRRCKEVARKENNNE